MLNYICIISLYFLIDNIWKEKKYWIFKTQEHQIRPLYSQNQLSKTYSNWGWKKNQISLIKFFRNKDRVSLKYGNVEGKITHKIN